MSPWLSRVDVARKLGVTRPRIHALEANGQLPPPSTDPETQREGWPSGELAHLLAARAGRQSSLSLASLPETTTAAPLRLRQILRHRQSPHRRQDMGQALATVYTTAHDGEVVLLQPLTPGRTLMQRRDIFIPTSQVIGGFASDYALSDAVAAACTALGYDDPYQVRWLTLEDALATDGERLHELIVEAAEAGAGPQRPGEAPQPFAVTLHEIHPGLVSARLGDELEVMPTVVRSAAAAEAWAAADWDPQWQAPVDLDGSAARALTASTLYGLSAPETNELAQLVRASVTVRQAPTTDGTQPWLPRGEEAAHLRLRPVPVMPATPKITGPTQPQPQNHSDPGRLEELMVYARDLLDFVYIDGATPDPVVRAALEVGMDAAEAAYQPLMNRKRGYPYRPRPSYWLRLQTWADLPAQVDTRPVRSEEVSAHRAGILVAEATARGLAPLDQPLHMVGGALALPVAGPGRQDHLLLMAPSLGSSLSRPHTAYADWSQLRIHEITREGLAWVAITGQAHWLPMPLSHDEPMTTGYNGTGPGNTESLICDFLTWIHGRKLTTTERGIIHDRTHCDKSTWVIVERSHLITLPEPSNNEPTTLADDPSTLKSHPSLFGPYSRLFGPKHSPTAFTDTVHEAVLYAQEHDYPSGLVIVATPDTDREAVLAGVRHGDYGEGFLAEALAKKLSPQAQPTPCDEDIQQHRTARHEGVPAVSLLDPSAGQWDRQRHQDTRTGALLEHADVVLDLTLTTTIPPTGQKWDGGASLAPSHPTQRHSTDHHNRPASDAAQSSTTD